jgi:hypothetical protein
MVRLGRAERPSRHARGVGSLDLRIGYSFYNASGLRELKFFVEVYTR